MLIQYGSYQHQVSSSGITVSSEIEETDSGVPVRLKNTVSIEGRIRNHSGGSSLDLDSLIAQMEQAYSIPGQDFGLLHDDGRRTQAYWTNASTIGGIRPKFLAYPNYKGGEYWSYRQFRIGIEFYTPVDLSVIYLKFTEQISVEGGGQSFGVKEVNYGPGIRQRLRTHTKCTASQTGSAIGRNRFPAIPPPIWPFALRNTEPKVSRTIRPRGSRFHGNIVLEECEVSWAYEYEWPTRLDGVPHYALG
jgi:hypothetical protein